MGNAPDISTQTLSLRNLSFCWTGSAPSLPTQGIPTKPDLPTESIPTEPNLPTESIPATIQIL